MPEFKGYSHHYRGPRIVVMFVMKLFIILIFTLILGYIVELIWNWLGPVLFGLKQIGYWEGVGIIIICRILFGSFSAGHGHRGWDERRLRMIRHMHMTRGDDFWKTRGGWSKWKYYNDYWNEEGRAAFEKYIERCEGKTEAGEKKDDSTGTGT